MEIAPTICALVPLISCPYMDSLDVKLRVSPNPGLGSPYTSLHLPALSSLTPLLPSAYAPIDTLSGHLMARPGAC